MSGSRTISEAQLHAYVDGQLDDRERAEVEAYLADHPAEVRRVEDFRAQNAALQALGGAFLGAGEQDPYGASARAASSRRVRWWWRPSVVHSVAAALWLVVGGIGGWMLHTTMAPEPEPSVAVIRWAQSAHETFAPERLHPVEVQANDRAHLTQWLSRRVGMPLEPPQLEESGYRLMGGRLVPARSGPTAMFMYEDEQGGRLLLYARPNTTQHRNRDFVFTRQGNLSICYWRYADLEFALTGELQEGPMLRIARSVAGQLRPRSGGESGGSPAVW